MADFEFLKFQFSVGVLLLTLLCYGAFVILIGLDIWRAIKKWAVWLPGKALALTGVTVQVIVWWTSASNLTTNVSYGLDEESYAELLVDFYQNVISGKVALCVFIGYLLPGMASPDVRTFLALGVTICFQIGSELSDLQRKREHFHEKFLSWAKFANLILFTCIAVLGLLSVCMILGSQTICGLLKKRTCSVFSITNEDEFQLSNEQRLSISWTDFEEEVLNSWLVARICRADYVICRSVFSSAIGVVVTISFLIFLLSNTSHNKIFYKAYGPTPYIIFSPLLGFIIIGWIVVCWRWLTAQLYFRSHGHSWSRCLRLDDFWTRDTVDLIHMYDLKSERKRLQNSEGCIDFLKRLPAKIFYTFMHKLVFLVLILQWSVVFFSKLCGLLSEVTVGKFMYGLRTHMRKRHPIVLPKKYERTLKLICMPGEDPSDLWEANQMCLNKARLLMQQSCEKGKPSEEINSIFREHFFERVEGGEQILNMLQAKAIPSVSEHFPTVEKRCLRITIVSLITISIRLHSRKSDPFGKIMKLCHEIWDLLSFTDEYNKDLETNGERLFDGLITDTDQVSMASERELYRLKMEYEKLGPGSGGEEHVIDIQAAREILQDLLDKCKEFLGNENLLGGDQMVAANLSDSKDWMKIAPKYYLYKLCRLMLEDDESTNFVAWTKKALQNVIAYSVSRLPDMIVKHCWKCAQDFDEDKLWEAMDLAGKCKGVMEAWIDKGMDDKK